MSDSLTDPWIVALSMGFARQECWSGLPFPSPGDLPNPGIEPRSPALQADTLTSEPPGKPQNSKFYKFTFKQYDIASHVVEVPHSEIFPSPLSCALRIAIIYFTSFYFITQ